MSRNVAMQSVETCKNGTKLHVWLDVKQTARSCALFRPKFIKNLVGRVWCTELLTQHSSSHCCTRCLLCRQESILFWHLQLERCQSLSSSRVLACSLYALLHRAECRHSLKSHIYKIKTKPILERFCNYFSVISF